jgi:maleate isomerase
VSRVGLIVPSSNSVMEVDFYRRLPAEVTLHTARMLLEETTVERESEMLDEHLPIAIRDVGTVRPDVVVFGCTSAGALRGNAYEAELVERIGEQTGADVVSVAASVRAGLAARGAHRIGVVTPYVDALNQKIRESLEADGFEVVGVRGLGITENFTIADVEPARIAALAAETYRAEDVDLVFASCTNFRAFDAREAIELAVGVPAVTSNQAAFEAVLERLATRSAA